MAAESHILGFRRTEVSVFYRALIRLKDRCAHAWISSLSVSIQKNAALLESVPCDTKAWWWQAGHFPSQGERKYKNGEEKRLWQGGLIKTTWSACSVPVYKLMALQRICLLDTSTMGHPAQTTGWRKAGTWRLPCTKLQTCEEIPMWQTRASLWPHNHLLWKHRWKDPWAHAAMIKNVLRPSEAFRFKLRLWKTKIWQQRKRSACCVNEQNDWTWSLLYGAKIVSKMFLYHFEECG